MKKLLLVLAIVFFAWGVIGVEAKEKEQQPRAIYDFSIIGIWEKRCSDGFQGWQIKMFDTEKEALQYLDDNEAEGIVDNEGNRVGGGVIWFRDGNADYNELIFRGLYKLGDKLPIKKEKLPITLYKEQWIKKEAK